MSVTREQLQSLVDEGKKEIEIARIVGLSYPYINRVMSKLGVKKKTKTDRLMDDIEIITYKYQVDGWTIAMIADEWEVSISLVTMFLEANKITRKPDDRFTQIGLSEFKHQTTILENSKDYLVMKRPPVVVMTLSRYEELTK